MWAFNKSIKQKIRHYNLSRFRLATTTEPSQEPSHSKEKARFQTQEPSHSTQEPKTSQEPSRAEQRAKSHARAETDLRNRAKKKQAV
jgi:hypothetical protein